jgi:hypothetical protein
MSKSGSRQRKSTKSRPDSARADRGIYIGFLIIGLAVVGAAFLLTTGSRWREVALGYLIAMAWLVNLYAISAYLGKPLAHWQAALARLPMRCVGYGTRHGKPLEACHGQQNAKMIIFVSVAFSVVVLVGLSFLLIPAMRGG